VISGLEEVIRFREIVTGVGGASDRCRRNGEGISTVEEIICFCGAVTDVGGS
jgi:hypothetical protein